MSHCKIITLSSGSSMPQLGFGTWQSQPKEVETAVEVAVRNGYRHLDLAMIYENQNEVGAALKKVIPSVVKREDLWITSKCWNSAHQPAEVEKELDETLKQLGLDYLDLYLIHWPVAFPPGNGLFPPHPTKANEIALDTETTLVDTWKAMIALPKSKVKNVGVSNFTIEYIEAIIKATGVVPIVNQIEAHPLLQQDKLVAYSKEKNIHITAYSSLGNNSIGVPMLTEHPVVIEVAKKLGATPAQVLLAWGVYRDYSVIPKSVHESRIIDNFKQVELGAEDYEKLTAIGKGKEVRFNIPARFKPKWDIELFNEEAEKEATYLYLIHPSAPFPHIQQLAANLCTMRRVIDHQAFLQEVQLLGIEYEQTGSYRVLRRACLLRRTRSRRLALLGVGGVSLGRKPTGAYSGVEVAFLGDADCGLLEMRWDENGRRSCEDRASFLLATMSHGKIITLSSGSSMPQLGFGTWQSQPKEVETAVEVAVRNGYCHLDLAMIYENQNEVGAALKKVIPSVVKREDLWITSKCWNSAHQPAEVEKELDETLKQLGLDYLDLYLVHWPVAFPPGNGLFPPHPTKANEIALDTETTLVDTWKAMIALPKSKVKNVGVSNFTIEYIEAIIKATGVVPIVNQIEAHPLLQQDKLVAYSKEKNIHITAYSSLGNNSIGVPMLTEHPVVIEVAKKLGATPAQVLLAWGVYRDYSVIPKSVHESRIIDNFKQVELGAEDYEKLTAIGKGKEVRFNIPARFKPKWDIELFNEEAEKEATYHVRVQ
ncbi:Aldo keto reductase [Mycena chlorophos]|uniref:Aldo keto reductase n=1 Tax=Mycena chlorophos TaxID=658473 RepID=A0A8H6VVR9_MYCCL|nr:Aldo keto reductase [Mycena chlorophos]